MPYAEAIATYGSDKPDLRCGLEICDLSDVFRDSEFRVFKQIVAEGGVVRGFAVPGGNRYSRSQLDGLVDQAKTLGFTGLDLGQTRGAAAQLGESAPRGSRSSRRSNATGATSDDLLLMAAGKPEATSKLLGQLRLAIAKKENLLSPDAFEFLWVTDFPLLEYHEEDGRWYSMHHPFTSPRDEDIDRLETDPGSVRAKAYDLVLNGSEIGGGSIRIHDAALQSRDLPAPRHQRRGGEAAVRVLSRGAGLRHAAARRHRARRRSDRRDSGRRIVNPRGHRVSEDRQRARPDGRRALAGGRRSSCASCTSAPAEANHEELQR